MAWFTSSPLPSLVTLPTELGLYVTELVGEPELAALSRVNRRLGQFANCVLWNRVIKDPVRCQEVLLWAVEVGQHTVLHFMLERGVDPNFYYLSSLLRSRLQDVFAAQGGRRGTTPPRDDIHLQAEQFRETLCRDRSARTQAQYFQLKQRPPSNTLVQDLHWHITERHPQWQYRAAELKFAVSGSLDNVDGLEYYTWAPIHIAVLRGDTHAVRLLLSHGVDIEAQSSGACDCAAPALDGIDDTTNNMSPRRFRSIWTPLHLAMCSGDKTMADLLICNGASRWVGSLVRYPRPLAGSRNRVRPTITSLQNAAWLGSVEMCELLVNSPHGKFLNYANRRRYTSLHYAALGGHIRTVGKWLLEHGADFPDEGEADPQGLPQRFLNDPLRLLVMKHEYADALWLLNFCHLHLSSWSTSSLAILYCRVLAALCHLKLPVTYRTLTLRERQDSLCNTTPTDIKARDDRLIENMMDWTIERLVLARRLVKLGADPSLRQLTTRYRMPVVSNVVQDYMWLTPIEIAKRCEFTAMANLLENNVVGDIDAKNWDRWEFEALWIKPEDVENYFLGLDDDMPGESDDGEEERAASPEL